MKKKLTEMDNSDLDSYIRKWTKARDRCQEGSIEWRTHNRRIKRAEEYLS
jgi:hypothetical protein